MFSRLPSNLAKNRYTDVLCYDHSRVLLSQTDPDDPTTDYINANYVDGYKQKNAYICTQGKLQFMNLTRVAFIKTKFKIFKVGIEFIVKLGAICQFLVFKLGRRSG